MTFNSRCDLSLQVLQLCLKMAVQVLLSAHKADDFIQLKYIKQDLFLYDLSDLICVNYRTISGRVLFFNIKILLST